ncbi:MAG: RNA polymerase sigma factor [Acidimicrobiia bacterium]
MTNRDEQNPRFSRIFDANFEAIRAYCLRRLPEQDAYDASSEVFLVAWRRIDAVPEGDEARLWLYGVARNTVRTFDRTNRRVTRLRTRLNGHAAATAIASPEAQVVAGLEYQRIMTCFDRLSENDQEVLRLRLWEELSVPEIAVVFDCSKKAASKRYQRALARLDRRVAASDSRSVIRGQVSRGGAL